VHLYSGLERELVLVVSLLVASLLLLLPCVGVSLSELSSAKLPVPVLNVSSYTTEMNA